MQKEQQALHSLNPPEDTAGCAADPSNFLKQLQTNERPRRP
jgi:hypothetical protein